MSAEENAWRDLVVEQIPALRAFAWSVSRNGPDADDLVQETLIKAWRHRERFTPGTNLRAWLFTILRNTHYTNLNRRRREVRDEDDHYARLLETEPNQEWGAALGALRTALDQLPGEQREALILVGGAGLSYEEAADICACAVGTVKSRVNRARARLVKLLDFGGEIAEDDQGISSTRPTALRLSI
jgi:RNA polymerase sigma-70 factor (ECF subfamily)